MPNFLLHQKPNGEAVGIFNESGDHYYLPSISPEFEKYGLAVVSGRNKNSSWEDWIEQQASKSPSPNAMWDVYPHEDADPELVLHEAIRDTDYTN